VAEALTSTAAAAGTEAAARAATVPARKFSACGARLTVTVSRLHPTSWWGSIVPFLEVSLRPLETLFTHPVPALVQWARETHASVVRRRSEQRRDDEDC